MHKIEHDSCQIDQGRDQIDWDPHQIDQDPRQIDQDPPQIDPDPQHWLEIYIYKKIEEILPITIFSPVYIHK